MSVKSVTFTMPTDLKSKLDDEARKVAVQRGSSTTWADLVRETLHARFMAENHASGNKLQT